MCFHLYPTGFCCQGSMNWFITPEDRVYSARLCVIPHSQPLWCLCSLTLNAVLVNCQSVLCIAGLVCWQMAWRRGPRRESCQSQSVLCCCSNLRTCIGLDPATDSESIILRCSRCVWTAFEKKKPWCSINIQYEFKIQKAQWWSQLMVIYTLASV